MGSLATSFPQSLPLKTAALDVVLEDSALAWLASRLLSGK
jgi:hypothetical protein